MRIKFKFWFALLCTLIILIDLTGCALEKELPPARNQSEIDKAFDEGLEANKKIAAQNAGKKNTRNIHIGAISDNDHVLDALLPPVSKAPVESRFNVTVNELPARQFYMGLVEDTLTNIIVHPEVAGNITLNLKNVTVPEVMSITREVYGFNFKKKGNNYFVYPNSLQTRLFRVNYINLVRSGSSSIDVSSGQITKTEDSDSDSGSSSSSSTTANTKFGTQLMTEFKGDLWDELAASLRTIIGNNEGRNIVVNPQTGVVLVKAMPDELMRVEEFLEATQAITGRQVLLEAKIIEVELADGFQAGINWVAVGNPSSGKTITGGQVGVGSLENAIGLGANIPGFGGGSGGIGSLGSEVTTPFGGVFTLALDLNDFQAMIELLGTQGDVQVLSSPRIATMNNQKAVIKVGTDQFFVTDLNSSNTSGSDGSASEIPDVELTPFFSGVALDVTPQIDNNGEIILHIHPSISDVSEDDRNISFSDELNISLPMAKSTIRESDSIIRAKNGQMVIIGGLMSNKATDDNASVPFFGDIPLVGNAFKHQREVTIKSELVIMLKATYLDNDNVINNTVSETHERFKALKKYDVSGRPSSKEPSKWFKPWDSEDSAGTSE